MATMRIFLVLAWVLCLASLGCVEVGASCKVDVLGQCVDHTSSSRNLCKEVNNNFAGGYRFCLLPATWNGKRLCAEFTQDRLTKWCAQNCGEVFYTTRPTPGHCQGCKKPKLLVYHLDKLNVPSDWNDEISSVKVGVGCRLAIYRDYNQRGNSHFFDHGNVGNLQDVQREKILFWGINNWNDVISSYQCVCDGGLDGPNAAATWPDFMNRHILDPATHGIPNSPQDWQNLMNNRGIGNRYRNTFIREPTNTVRNVFKRRVAPPSTCVNPWRNNYFQSSTQLNIIDVVWNGSNYVATRSTAWVIVAVQNGYPVHFETFF